MTETRGVWSLSEAWEEKTAAEWVPLPSVWVSDADYTPPSVPYSDRGYTLGGSSTGPSSNGITSIEKLTFSNGTSSIIPATVLNPRNDERGCSGPTQGISGAQGGPSPQKMVKLTLSDESTTAMPTSQPVGGHANPFCGNSTVAYAAAMHGTLKYTYASSTFACPSQASIANPSASYWNQWGAGAGSATAGTPNEGYWSWAKTESWFSKITYATDTGTVRVGNLLSASYMGYDMGGSASATNAYWYGGGNVNGTNWPSPSNKSMQVMSFSTLTTRLSPGTIEAANRYRGRIPNGNTECYLIGGSVSYPSPNSTTVAKVTYATETCSAHPSPINVARQKNGGYSPAGDGAISATPRERWFDGAAPSPSVTPPTIAPGAHPRGYPPKTYRYNDTIYDHGYIAGGEGSPGGLSSDDRLMKLALSTDTATEVPAGVGPNYRGTAKGLSSGNGADAFFAGGYDTSDTNLGESYLRRVQYSNDTASLGEQIYAASSYYGTSHKNRKGMIAFGKEDFGFFALGRSGTELSNMIRLNYSNFTNTWAWRSVPHGNWPQSYDGDINANWPGSIRQSAATGGNPTNAYIGTASASGVYSNVLRYKYVQRVSTTVPSGNNFKTRTGGTGNNTETHWYIGGGYDGSSNLSSFDKMDFASETVGALPGTNLTATSAYGSGVAGGTSHAYWCGISATVGNKVNFSTETVSSVPISSGSNPGKYASGTSMKDFANNISPIIPEPGII